MLVLLAEFQIEILPDWGVPMDIVFERTLFTKHATSFMVAVMVTLPLPTLVTVAGFPVDEIVAMLVLDEIHETVALHGIFEIE